MDEIETFGIGETAARLNALLAGDVHFICRIDPKTVDLIKAEQADTKGALDSQSLPEELARREKLAEQLDAACQRLESQAKARAESERGEYERKVAAREARKGRRKGGKIKPPDDTPGGGEQTNLTDPDSGLRLSTPDGRVRAHQVGASRHFPDDGGSPAFR